MRASFIHFIALGALVAPARAHAAGRCGATLASLATGARRAVTWSAARIAGNVLGLNFHFHRETALPLAEWRLFGRRPFAASERSVPKPLMRGMRFVEDFTNPVLRKLFPGLLTGLASPTDHAFRELWRDPYGETPPDVRRLLEKYGKLAEYEKCKERLAKAPWLRRVLRSLGHVETWGFRLVAALAAFHAGTLAEDESATPSLERYLDDKAYAPADDEVQLFVESVPFPHMAIRIGDVVYSYGVSYMTATSPEAYLGKQRLHRMMTDLAAIYRDKAAHDPETIAALQRFFPEEEVREWAGATAGPTDDSSGKSLATARAALPLERLERTVQVVTLKVGKQKRDELRRYFELHKGMVYDNRTFVNDCASMVMRPLGTFGRFGPAVDPSPSTVVTLLSAARAMGDDRVGKIFQIGVDGSPRPKSQLLRNAYINYLEGSIHFGLLPINLPERLRLDARRTPEQLQMWPESAKAQFAEWKRETRLMADDEVNLQFFLGRATDFASEPETDALRAKKRKLLTLAEAYLDAELARAEESHRNPNASLREIFVAEYRLEVLREKQAEMRAKLRPVP